VIGRRLPEPLSTLVFDYRARAMMTAARTFYSRNRRRLSALVLIVGALVVGQKLSVLVPRTTEVVLDLGPRHAEVVELRLSYQAAGEALRSVRYSHPEGAPARVRDQVRSHVEQLELESVLVLRDGSSLAREHQFATSLEHTITLDARP
jgi:hypothetical protein